MQKPINEIAGYLKNIIPANIPETYTLKPVIRGIGNEKNIRSGVLAFRDFLFLVCDQLIVDGSLYDKPPKKDDSHLNLSASYPFLHHLRSILFNIGEYGKLIENGTSIKLSDPQSLTFAIDDGKGERLKSKISEPKIIEVLRFLTNCGICFDGINLDERKPDLSKVASLKISYSDNPVMLMGLKVMAIAQKKLYTKGNEDIFLRCDYRVLKDEPSDVTSLLKDFVSPLPAKVRNFALKLHQRYLDAGLICKVERSLLKIWFTYWHKNTELWSFTASFGDYRLLIKAQNIHQYADVIKKFPAPLQKTIAKGYGCEKKRYGKPCQKGCHGFGFSLDESVVEIGKYIEIWLDRELKGLKEGFGNVPIESPSQTTPLTLNFNDMTLLKDNCPYSISKDGALDVNYGGQWKEVKFCLPVGVNLANCSRIIVNGISSDVRTAIKFYHKGTRSGWDPKFAMYDNKTSFTSDWNYTLNDTDKSHVIRSVGIMAQENSDNCRAVINSITFS